MAPELFVGKPADATSDQFALGVALYKALYDQRPYGEGDSVASLLDAMKLGQLRPPPRQARVPAAIHAIVARSLACSPRERWPNVDALVAALADDPTRVRARLASLAFTALAAVSAGLAVHHEAPVPICASAATQLEPLWNPPRRAAVAASFAAVESRWAALAGTTVDQRLDAYTRQWIDAHRDACEATHVRGEQSARVLDQRMRCLDHGRRELETLVEVLERGGVKVLERAVSATAGLPELARCADLDRLASAEFELAAGQRAVENDALSAALDRVEVLLRMGQFERARATLDEHAARVEALGHPPTQARFGYARGCLLGDTGEYEAAAAQLDAAFHLALRSELRPLAAHIASRQTLIIGERLADHEGGERWLKLAESLIAETPKRRAHLLSRRAALIYRSGEYRDALATYREAIALIEHDDEPSPDLASFHNGVGLCLLRMSRAEEARAPLRRAVELMGQTLGDDHPRVAATLLNLAAVETKGGDLERGRAAYERAIEVLEAGYGPEHPNLGVAHVNLAGITRRLGDLDAATHSGERAVAIYRARVGTAHPKYALALAVLSRVELARGELDLAQAHAREGLDVMIAKYGDAHPNLLRPQLALIRVYIAQGELDAALALSERSLAVSSEDTIRADVVSERERALRLSARKPGARDDIEASVHICDEITDCGDFDLAELLFALARVDAEPAHARRALALLGQSPQLDDGPAQLRAALAAWLDAPKMDL